MAIDRDALRPLHPARPEATLPIMSDALLNRPTEGLMPGPNEELLFEGRPALVQGIGGLLLAIVTLGISLVFAWFKTRGIHYKITSQRVVIENGVFSKRMEQLDLYRVVDYVVERPFGQRIMGTGNIVLEAMDKTTPEIRIKGIKTDVMKLYEKLRYSTEQEKKKRNVRVLDIESTG
jgi:uncharacterized membrane protein YdbT with pleckstrin-like domain